MIIVRLIEKKDNPILNGHPWIFSGSIDTVTGSSEEGHLCRVLNSKGHFVCQGMYNPLSNISVRVLSLEKTPVTREFLQARIQRAINLRKKIIPETTNCFRLINAEGDHLPGLIVDIYDNVLVMQFLCPGMEDFKNELVHIFHSLYPQAIIHERSDVKSRRAEGLFPQSGPLYGTLSSGDIPTTETGVSFVVNVLTGDRTGFYLDHRSNRCRLQSFTSGKDVLDLFCYTGAFSLYALKAQARSVVSVDSSAPAQAILRKNIELNSMKQASWKHVRDDTFSFLAQENSRYDVIVCDPPPFSKGHEEYTKINTLAIEHLKPGGFLFTFAQNTPQFSSADLLKALNRASKASGRTAKIIEPLFQSPDFAILPSHPQGTHLLGFIVYVD